MTRPAVTRWLDPALALAGLALAVLGLSSLAATRDGLVVTRTAVGTIPVTVFERAGAPPAPAVLIGHGFAGSQQLMQPFAVTLARGGYRAVTFDFAGHGRNPTPMPGTIADHTRRTAALVAEARSVLAFARALPGSDGRAALLGHSMANEVLFAVARDDPGVSATVAVSPFLREGGPALPRDTLVLLGALEPAILRDAALRVLPGGPSGGEPARTYGEIGRGDAVRLEIVSGAEHIAILYVRDSLAAARDWLDRVFARTSGGEPDRRASALALLILGVVLLARPASSLLPVIADPPSGGGASGLRLAAVAIVPALVTPFVATRLPAGGIPILTADYLVWHFLVYGAVTAAVLALARALPRRVALPGGAFLAAVIASSLYAALAPGLPVDAYFTSLAPAAERTVSIALLFGAALAYTASDEWATRGPAAWFGAYAATKLGFLVSLVGAIALDPPRLFFLAIIVPVMLAFFLVFGLFSAWVYRRTGHPLVGAVMCATVYAVSLAVTFPLVAS